MFFNTNPYLILAKLGGSLPNYQGNVGSSEFNTSTLVDENNDGISDFIQPPDVVEGNVSTSSNAKVDPATGLTFD